MENQLITVNCQNCQNKSDVLSAEHRSTSKSEVSSKPVFVFNAPPYAPLPYKRTDFKMQVIKDTLATPTDHSRKIFFDLITTYTEGCYKIRGVDFVDEYVHRQYQNMQRNLSISSLAPVCIEFLSHHNDPGVQYEAARFLVNVTANVTPWTKLVVNNGAIPKLVELIKSPATEVAEQAVCALGNIAADNLGDRNLILETNCLPSLLDLLETEIPVCFTRDIIRTIGNLLRNSNLPFYSDAVQKTLPVLEHLLTKEDPDIVADARVALSYLAEGEDGQIQAVIILDVDSGFVGLLASPDSSVLSSALDDVGNMVHGSDGLINVAPILSELIKLLDHEDLDIVKKAASAIKIVSARERVEIEDALLPEALSALLDGLIKGDFESQKDIARAMVHLMSKGFESVLAAKISMKHKTFYVTLKTRDEEDEAELLQAFERVTRGRFRMFCRRS